MTGMRNPLPDTGSTETGRFSVDGYLASVETLAFGPLSRAVWRAVRDEGLDNETGKPRSAQWTAAILDISSEDRDGLIAMTDEALEKFNLFDIMLKERH
jgi:hypothetical protein